MKTRTLLLAVVLLPLFAWAQTTEQDKSFYQPKVSGLIKAKWEYSFEDNTNRFDIRNSRIGIGGNINKATSYRMQVEYGNHGRIDLLDAYALFMPKDNIVFWFGQFTVPFSEDYVISPSLNMFANRAFVGKFIDPNSRDIGARVDYMFSKKVPVMVQAGVYNGAGINNPQWQDSPFLLGRLIYGTMMGFRTSVKYYGGKDLNDKKIAYYGVDFRYATNKYKIEAEYAIKDSIGTSQRFSGAYLQGAYNFTVNNNNLLKYIEPTLRTDGMAYNIFDNGFDISRLTFGLNFGLDPKYMAAEIRLNYEHFFFHKSKDAIKNTPFYRGMFDREDKGLFNKLSIEFLIRF